MRIENVATIPHTQCLTTAVERQSQGAAWPNLVGGDGVRRIEIFFHVIKRPVANEPAQGDDIAIWQDAPDGQAKREGPCQRLRPIFFVFGAPLLLQAVHFRALDLGGRGIGYAGHNYAQNGKQTPTMYRFSNQGFYP